ncbi:MAG TPA: homocysteine S-methyltransferase family protein [Aliidongia sp.]|uniref:homocysteine S-methyltransferase family protein n=1 Tax=Aliidongia sp. TaxID=1914230 RepID=UPI002DDCFBDE|nr:homocysteine S-methyltransferase family protein [Aliidongia sp.]HEV2675649.1 homocysteine S-methyltransferase family protein [Aliidongia sp.]
MGSETAPRTARYRHSLPQLSSDLFLTDGGLETDLIFNHGIAIEGFAAHTLLSSETGRAAMDRYFDGFLSLAREVGAGFILHSATWKAHRHWADALGATVAELKAANEESIRFIAGLRRRFANPAKPIVLNAIIGPRGDAYSPEVVIPVREAEDYFSEQIGWLVQTEADMISGMTFSQASEAAGFLCAARRVGMPAALSFTVEADGMLATGQSLGDAVREVEAASNGYCAYYMINCAHPTHFAPALGQADWTRRIRGLRANASTKSHAELDGASELDAGDPGELAEHYRSLAARMPWINIFGGCCGTDLRHVAKIAEAIRPLR